MERIDFTQYDIKPEAMVNYLRYNGPHFSKKLCEFAVSKMEKNGSKIQPITKERLQQFMQQHNVILKNDMLYDSVYVANMCKADYLGSSITDDHHLLLFVRDTLEDPDGYDGMVFNRWYSDMCRKGIAIDWEEML